MAERQKKKLNRWLNLVWDVKDYQKLDDTVDSIAIAISYTRSPDAIQDLKKFEK